MGVNQVHLRTNCEMQDLIGTGDGWWLWCVMEFPCFLFVFLSGDWRNPFDHHCVQGFVEIIQYISN
jgi:hypothetical protein